MAHSVYALSGILGSIAQAYLFELVAVAVAPLRERQMAELAPIWLSAQVLPRVVLRVRNLRKEVQADFALKRLVKSASLLIPHFLGAPQLFIL